MSWQDYVDNLLASGDVYGAVIVGLDGGLWARSDSLLRISQDEINAVLKSFEPEGYQAIVANGCFLAGEKYMAISGNQRTVYLRRGSSGAALAKTGSCVIIGVHSDAMVPGNFNSAIGRVADFLIESGC